MSTSRLLHSSLLLLLLTACAEEPPETTPAASIEAKIEAQSLEKDHHTKQSLPVSLAYEFDSEPAVGEPLAIQLVVRADSAVERAKLSVGTRGALEMSANSASNVDLQAVETAASGGSEYQVVVTPSEAGRSYVTVQINGVFDGQPFTKAMTVPVQVGEGGPTLETNGVLIDDGTEILSSMPADMVLESETAE